MTKKLIITTKDLNLVEPLQKKFPKTIVLVTNEQDEIIKQTWITEEEEN